MNYGLVWNQLRIFIDGQTDARYIDLHIRFGVFQGVAIFCRQSIVKISRRNSDGLTKGNDIAHVFPNN